MYSLCNNINIVCVFYIYPCGPPVLSYTKSPLCIFTIMDIDHITGFVLEKVERLLDTISEGLDRIFDKVWDYLVELVDLYPDVVELVNLQKEMNDFRTGRIEYRVEKGLLPMPCGYNGCGWYGDYQQINFYWDIANRASKIVKELKK